MAELFLGISVIFMALGHMFKVKRWKLFIAVYEEPSEADLLNALSFGHTINAILPIRVGDIIRVLWAGRKMKNGCAFSAATVIADLYVDLITVGAMFWGLRIIGKGGRELQQAAYMYMYAFVLLVCITTVAVTCRKWIKKMIGSVAALFNSKIEFALLYVTYLSIASVKDILRNINKKRFVYYTAGIWSTYVASYVIFAEAIQRFGYYYATSDVFTELFTGACLYHIQQGALSYWIIYLLLPLGVCWLYSCIINCKKNLNEQQNYRYALPQMNRADRLSFLKMYYAEEERGRIQAYLEINKDVIVMEDKSAGSNASTVLVMKPNGGLFFRKYAFDEDGEKLHEQVDWIERHYQDIPLPLIVNKKCGTNYFVYDMYSYGNAIGLFRYLHMVPVEEGWKVLRNVLEDIHVSLHSRNARATDGESVRKYVSAKVVNNLNLIRENGGKYITGLEQYDVIYVNGEEFGTLDKYRRLLSEEHLLKIFAEDEYADIHGDLTIENIICLSNNYEIDKEKYSGKVLPQNYYLIDPNTGNIHESPFLDYGKLLQSLHGGYEFLMMVSSVNIERNKVKYMMIQSEVYAEIYAKYKKYLQSQFNHRQIISIYYHEIVHWLRLMNYKIKRDEKLAVVFYTGLLKVLKDVWEMENEK